MSKELENAWAVQEIWQDKCDKLEEENRKLKEYNGELIENHKKDISILCEENRKLKEEIRFLEQCLDNKEKVNKSLREENKKLKDKLESLEK